MSAGLSVLPPSPPTITSRRHISNLDVPAKPAAPPQVTASQRTSSISLGTPNESPASYLGSSGSVSGRKRKRVEFSPWTNMQDPPAFTTSSSPGREMIRPLPPSRECSSTGSILKVSAPPDSTNDYSNNEPKPKLDVGEMLESIIQQLSKDDTVSSLDAYQTLSSSLKTYDDIPNSLAFKAKMSSLTQYIRRDLTILDEAKFQAGDVNLLTQALKVLAILVWNPNLAALLNVDFQSFVIEHVVRAIERNDARLSEDAGNGKAIQERRLPKIIILHYLHLLSTQNFRQSVVIGGHRVQRLLKALRELTNRVAGSGVVSQRLLVYQKLIDQVKSIMQGTTRHWARELVEALVATNKDVRSKAICLGSKVMTAMPSSSALSESVAETLNDPAGDGASKDKTRSSQMCRRLETMLNIPEESNQVPQIWAIVLSLRKSSKDRIETWAELKDWIKVIQKCFNSSIPSVRSQANLAWTRFIRVVNSTEASDSMLSMLTKPITAQLERKEDMKHDKSSRAIAFSTYCSLLYYAFRPGASHKQYDRMWNETIVKVIKSSFLEANSVNPDRASRILISLLWNGNAESKFWREGRAQESGLIETDDLPTIDPRWIRSRTKSILQLFQLLFRLSSWGSGDDPGEALVAVAWKHFSNALGDASCKEVISSPDLVNAVSEITGFLEALWKNDPPTLNVKYESPKTVYITRYRYICMTMLSEIGVIPLTDGSFPYANGFDLRSQDQNSHTTSISPIVRILKALTTTTTELAPVDASRIYMDLLKDMLALVGKARGSSLSRIHLYKQIAQSVYFMHEYSTTPFEADLFWRPLAELALLALQDSNLADPIKTNLDQYDLVEDIIYFLQQGLSHSSKSHELWHRLFQETSRLIKLQDQSFEPTIWPVIERLGKFSYNKTVPHPSPYAGYLVRSLLEQNIEMTKDERSQVKGRQSRERLPRFFIQILDILSLDLELCYWDESTHDESVFSGVIDATCETLLCWPSGELIECFTILKLSIMKWLEDSARLQTSATSLGALKLALAQKLCPLVIEKLGTISSSAQITEDLGDILAAGFRSTHKMTINEMIVMWNSTYGTKKHQHYPTSLQAAIEHLQPFVEIETPRFESQSSSQITQSRPKSFTTLYEDADDLLPADSNGEIVYPADLIEASSTPNAAQTEGPSAVPDPLVPVLQQTPSTSVKRAKLRHDNSQIEFVPIESSPLATVGMESQMMTGRQKEIKDRRRAEPAVIFSDLRSSPRSVRDSGIIQSAHVDVEEVVQDARLTPVLAPQTEAFMDQMTTSSPTPQPKQLAFHLDEIEIHSSPPSIPSAVAEQTEHIRPYGFGEPVVEDVAPLHNRFQADEHAGLDDICALDGTVSESSKVLVLEERRELLLPGGDEDSLPDTIIGADETEAPLFAHGQGGIVSQSNAEHLSPRRFLPDTKEACDPETPRHIEVPNEVLPSDIKTLEPAQEHEHIEPEEDYNFGAADVALTFSLNSDEIEKLSASQISQDLDCHVTEQARTSQTTTSPLVKPAVTPTSGKRKASVEPMGSIWKRKTPRSKAATQQIPLSDDTQPPKESDLLDCIVVDSMPRMDRIRSTLLLESRVSQDSITDAVGKRPRGRPRKSASDEIVRAESSTASAARYERLPETRDPSHLDTRSPEITTPIKTEDRSPPADGLLNTDSASNVVEVHKQPKKHGKPAGLDTYVLGSLQDVLRLLKQSSTSIRKPMLREVDDLLFEIRTEAQHAAERANV